ncbi:hypothetical protein Ancab_033696 [Ancistrocladus abbreviatus]
MADELIQAAGICGGGAWWNKGLFSGGSLSSPCSATLTGDYIGGFGYWGRSCGSFNYEETANSSVCDVSSMVFPPITAADIRKPVSPPPQQQPDSGGSNGGVLMDSATLQIMGFGLSSSSSTTDWNQQTLLPYSFGRGRTEGSEGNYNSILPEDVDSRLDYGQAGNHDHINAMNNDSTFIDHDPPYSIDQQPMNSSNSSGDSTPTCEGSTLQAVSFPMSPSASYALIQSLLEARDHLQPRQGSPFFDNSQTMPYSSLPVPDTYQMNVKSPNSWQRSSPLNLQPNNSLTKHQIGNNGASSPLNYLNNSLMSPTFPLNNIRPSLLSPPAQSPSKARAHVEGRSCSSLEAKGNAEKVRGSGSVVTKSNNDPPFKKPRLETPSPLPTFKVRKEKLGDRITALQQLVSPFGKTDTASVLHEAIECIKFLHDQVSVLSTPYLRTGSPIQHQQACEKLRDNNEMSREDLRSRGLCLVPISCTYLAAHETPVDFWTPTFGATFK